LDEACTKLGSKLRDITAQADESTVEGSPRSKTVAGYGRKARSAETRAGEP